MEMCNSLGVFFKRCALLLFLSSTAWNWDMSTVILVTTQDKDEGHTLVMLGQKTENSLRSFVASISILGCIPWDFFYCYCYLGVFCNRQLNLILCDTHSFCFWLVH